MEVAVKVPTVNCPIEEVEITAPAFKRSKVEVEFACTPPQVVGVQANAPPPALVSSTPSQRPAPPVIVAQSAEMAKAPPIAERSAVTFIPPEPETVPVATLANVLAPEK